MPQCHSPEVPFYCFICVALTPPSQMASQHKNRTWDAELHMGCKQASHPNNKQQCGGVQVATALAHSGCIEWQLCVVKIWNNKVTAVASRENAATSCRWSWMMLTGKCCSGGARCSGCFGSCKAATYRCCRTEKKIIGWHFSIWKTLQWCSLGHVDLPGSYQLILSKAIVAGALVRTIYF